jgi:hypothetical protein
LCLQISVADTAQQSYQVRNQDGFERTHSILDPPANALVGAAGHKSVELLDAIFPGERIRRHAGEILNFMLDHFAVL